MDGENKGKPYFQMDDLGVPLFLETPWNTQFAWVQYVKWIIFRSFKFSPYVNKDASKTPDHNPWCPIFCVWIFPPEVDQGCHLVTKTTTFEVKKSSPTIAHKNRNEKDGKTKRLLFRFQRFWKEAAITQLS